ncbi:MAG: extracellular solute-binding protein [Candidatus Kaiserbacteria bacterium]|nr:extracellular solute-binding protein [Candidatus Kaiserbacteria bacterium]
MKTLSIFQLVLLGTFGTFGIIGVLVFALAVGGNSNSTAGKVEIWGILNGKAISEVLAQAGDTDPNLKEVGYLEKDPATYESELTNSLAVGAGPDLILMRQDYVVEDAGKTIPFPTSDISGAKFQSLYIDAGTPYYSSTAGAVALPILADPLVLYWNRDILSAGGVAKPPAFWDEVLNIAQNIKINAHTDSGSISKSAIALGEYANVANAKDILSTIILQSGGAITANDNTGRLVASLSPGYGTGGLGVETALRFFTQFADPSKSYYSWNRSLKNSRQAFSAGDLALYIGFASENAQIASMNPNLNYGVAPMIQIREGGKTVNAARVYALAVSRTAKNPTGAAIVAKLISSPAISKNLSTALGMSSALRDVLAMPADGNYLLFNQQTLIARSWIDPDSAKTSDIFRGMIERVSTGSMQISDSIQRANDELGRILER